MKYREFKDADYTELRKRLIKEKGSSFQREFLERVKDSDDYVRWMEEELDVTDEDDFTSLSDVLTEAEYKDPPELIEKHLFDTWKDITPAQACSSAFWGRVTLDHIKNGKIKSSYLAANGGTLPGGLERIDKVLKGGTDKEIDDTVRTIIRRMSGLPEARGNRSVYVNCPFARAWWRGYIANEVCDAEDSDVDIKAVIRILRWEQSYWEELISSVVSKNSVLGDTNVRAALIWTLSDLADKKENKSLFTGKGLSKLIKKIGTRAAFQELATYGIPALKILLMQWFID